MKESLLQFIWQYQYFNSRDLRTTTGEAVQVLAPGQLNVHQGPDFLDARLQIGGTFWAGAVELHIVASDWGRHAHATDKNYRNVILHVVWENDVAEQRTEMRNGERDIPMLVLEHRVPKWLLDQYAAWMKDQGFVACQRQLGNVREELWQAWKQQLTEERLRRRAHAIGARLAANRQHWEETCWWLMARAFGGPVNGAAFEMLARTLPITLLARQGTEGDRLEALLLGQAGFLDGVFKDDHPRMLQQEFRHLRSKYQLATFPVPIHFLRMRPGSFPTIRLAQLARLLASCADWFSRAREATGPGELKTLMTIAAGPYWDDHYIPDRPSVRRTKHLGEAMKDSLLINVFIPLLYGYGSLRDSPGYLDKAIRWLRALDGEKNAIIDQWTRVGVSCGHAGDSQALLELKKRYCEARHCLQCAVGKALLSKQG
jgi:hypothetical protein